MVRIVYCLDNLYAQGGIVKITIIKANAFAAIEGYEVTMIVLDEEQPPMIPLDSRIKIICLNIGYCRLSQTNRLKLHWQELCLKWKHFSKLYKELNLILPDVVISTGQSGCHLLQYVRISSRPMKIREFHFIRNFMDYQCYSMMSKIRNLTMKCYDQITHFWGYDTIVILTEYDKQMNWKNFEDKVVVIPNPMTAEPSKFSNGESKIAIAVGRLSIEKNFGELIKIWGKVVKKHPDWHLQIFGDGWLKHDLEKQVERCTYRENVHLMGASNNVLDRMSEASIYLMTSEFEGFPLVLIEAMSVGIPIVSYDCPCGPRCIITDYSNGFLVSLHDEDQMAQKICLLIENEDERKLMGQRALSKSADFELDMIISRWERLFSQKIS